MFYCMFYFTCDRSFNVCFHVRADRANAESDTTTAFTADYDAYDYTITTAKPPCSAHMAGICYYEGETIRDWSVAARQSSHQSHSNFHTLTEEAITSKINMQ